MASWNIHELNTCPEYNNKAPLLTDWLSLLITCISEIIQYGCEANILSLIITMIIQPVCTIHEQISWKESRMFPWYSIWLVKSQIPQASCKT